MMRSQNIGDTFEIVVIMLTPETTLKERILEFIHQCSWDRIIEAFSDDAQTSHDLANFNPDVLPIALYFDTHEEATLCGSKLKAEFGSSIHLKTQKLDAELWSQPWEPYIEEFDTALFSIRFTSGAQSKPKITRHVVNLPNHSDFGTGQHATTKACLFALESLPENKGQPAHVLDMGTGTGILAIAAKRLFAHAEVLASDIEEDILNRAQSNFAANGLRIQTVLSDQVPSGQYDLLIANILFPVLIDKMADFSKSLTPSGSLLLAGFSNRHCELILAEAQKQGLLEVFRKEVRGWLAINLKRQP